MMPARRSRRGDHPHWEDLLLSVFLRVHTESECFRPVRIFLKNRRTSSLSRACPGVVMKPSFWNSIFDTINERSIYLAREVRRRYLFRKCLVVLKSFFRPVLTI